MTDQDLLVEELGARRGVGGKALPTSRTSESGRGSFFADAGDSHRHSLESPWTPPGVLGGMRVCRPKESW